MEDIKYLEGLEIFLGYKCNIKCTFCYQNNLRLVYNDNISKEKVLILLNEGFENGKKFVIFSGGEPTLDNNLAFYVDYSKKKGFLDIRIHTNGLGFIKNEYLIDLYNKGLTGIILSIHGYKNDHDNCVGVKGSFDIILKSLVNINKIVKEGNFILDINTVIYRKNYLVLYKLIIFLSKFNINRLQLVYSNYLVEFSKDEKKEILIRYSSIKKQLLHILFLGRKYLNRIVIEGIPYCVIPEKYRMYLLNNIKTNRLVYDLDNGYINNTDGINMLKIEECKKCSLNKECLGIDNDYLALYGRKEFIFIK